MGVYTLTGNPFADTGLGVIVAKAKELRAEIQSIEDLMDEDLRGVIGDGKWLAKANRGLKAFSMVVGTNSPLTNPSSNPSLSKKQTGRPAFERSERLNPEDDKGWKEYLEIINGLLRETTEKADASQEKCECCGERPASRMLTAKGKEIGRDWFPLAGSIGNDAQSLPAASRTPKICSLCLLAVQLLPLGTMLLNGKLACFQSTEPEITQMLIEDIYQETNARLQVQRANEKLTALGAKGGSTPAASILLKLFGNLQDNKRILQLPPYISLNVWLFTNSGAEPDCGIIEIPNSALNFLWEVAQKYRAEVDSLLKRESKKSDFQLLECIRRQRDYEGLYPYKNREPASLDPTAYAVGLFELYQTKALNRPVESLRVAEWIAFQIKQRFDEKQLKLFSKDLVDRQKLRKLKPYLRRMFSEMVEEGLLTLEEYTALFPSESFQPLRTQTYGWKWIWFYLNHEELRSEREYTIGSDVKMFTHPKIKQFARDIFNYYYSEKGLSYIKRRILDEFRRNRITTGDLQRWFLSLAEIKEGYTNEEWDNLCRDENGNNVIHEVRFQLRLELANLYRQQTSEVFKTSEV